ncbi:MAG: hypothetical protein H7245_21610 [Candidatus Saccharibacteria bacterium]|nr:hypothetical protein [Pseudorhodobacter sp.]
MQYLIWGGAAVTVASLIMLGWCVVLAVRIRGAALDEKAKQAGLQRVLVWNMGAMAVAGIGLMAVVVGVILA